MLRASVATIESVALGSVVVFNVAWSWFEKHFLNEYGLTRVCGESCGEPTIFHSWSPRKIAEPELQIYQPNASWCIYSHPRGGGMSQPRDQHQLPPPNKGGKIGWCVVLGCLRNWSQNVCSFQAFKEKVIVSIVKLWTSLKPGPSLTQLSHSVF